MKRRFTSLLANQLPTTSEYLVKELNTLLEQEESLKYQKYYETMVPVSLLGMGKCFGELALVDDPTKRLQNNKRQASILCLEDCQFAIISKKDYN